jgi:hypothetical protein
VVGEPRRPAARRSTLERLSSLGALLGAAGFAAGLTCVYMAMRALMRQTGGFCASGGPHQIAAGHQCSSGQTALLFGGIFATLIFGGLYAGATGAGGGPGSGMDAGFLMWMALFGFLMWTALFGSLGFNFLSLAIDPPSGQQGCGQRERRVRGRAGDRLQDLRHIGRGAGGLEREGRGPGARALLRRAARAAASQATQHPTA